MPRRGTLRPAGSTFNETAGGAVTSTSPPRISGSGDIENKNTQQQEIPKKYTRSTTSNPLRAYRSYTYIFTLASLKKESLKDPESYRNSENFFVIAKSSGKGAVGLIPPQTVTDDQLRENVILDEAENEERYNRVVKDRTNNLLIDGFNKRSAGRFDFYLNNVNIDTIMGGSEATGMTIATKVEFEVIEPYSMTGFIEALQVAAQAAGYETHTAATFLLKMDFVGHHENKETSGEGEIIPKCSRFFPIKITELEIDVTENGAKYRCKAVPTNEKAFGEQSILKSNVTISGSTVGEILDNLIKAVNDTKKSEAKSISGNSGKISYDEYSIEYPKIDDNGNIIGDSKNIEISDAKVIELLKDNAAYKFPEPLYKNTGTNVVKYNSSSPLSPNISFSENTNVYQAISAIIRDSAYVKDLLKKLENSTEITQVTDAQGMVNYFIINVEIEDKSEIDQKTNKPYQKIKYVILPYKIHYTRVPMMRANIIDNKPLIQAAHRTYDYLYTGQNTEIKSFNLKFNYLFYQAIPQSAGDQKGKPSAARGSQPNDQSTTVIGNNNQSSTAQVNGGSPVRTAPENTQVHVGSTVNAGQSQADPYSALAKNLHQAIIKNVDQATIEMDILGDPYYLTTAGVGNYRPKGNADGTVGDSEAPFNQKDVIIYITFRNPVDIDTNTGFAIFDDTLALYTGVFRVTEVASKFNDGVFTQRLKALKLPNQPEETTQPQQPRDTTPASGMSSVADPSQASTPTPPAPVSTMRAPTDNLALSIASGAPITGLPGELSKFASETGGNLAGFNTKANQLTFGSLLNQSAGGAGGPLQGYDSVKSAFRLASSGLSSLSTNINNPGASILQLTNTAASVGIRNAGNLAQTSVSMGSLSELNAGSAAIGKLTSLGSDNAGLMSNVSSNIEALKGTKYSLSTQLGVDTNKLSGLSPELQNKIDAQLKEATTIIPNDVDINAATKNGLIIDNISKNSLANIPPTQPKSYAPYPAISLNDFKAILDRGGNLSNIPGASTTPGVDNLVAARRGSLPSATGLDAGSIANKYSSIQSVLGVVTGQVRSREGSLANLSSVIPSGLPNNQNITSSVVNKFGSVSANNNSPLDILMKTL